MNVLEYGMWVYTNKLVWRYVEHYEMTTISVACFALGDQSEAYTEFQDLYPLPLFEVVIRCYKLFFVVRFWRDC